LTDLRIAITGYIVIFFIFPSVLALLSMTPVVRGWQAHYAEQVRLSQEFHRPTD